MKPVPGAALAAALALLIAACAAGSGDGAAAAGSPRADAPATSKARVVSTEGFSFLPPQGPDWTEAMDGDRVEYTKTTNHDEVTFYAGAVDGKLDALLATPDALLAFVRAQKDQWGEDGWELVTVIAGPTGGLVAYLKRPRA